MVVTVIEEGTDVAIARVIPTMLVGHGTAIVGVTDQDIRGITNG